MDLFLVSNQISVVDWRREAAAMEDIHRNSVCNIAATGALNSDQGCFAERNPSLMPPGSQISLER